MLKKRLIGVVTVKGGWVVQSMGYDRYLPLGRPEVHVANLDRWGADEILLQCIDRTRLGLGPDFHLLERIGRSGLSTPIIYSGGVRHAEDAVRAVKQGADRLCVNALLHDNPSELEALSRELGAQALIANVPISMEPDGPRWLDYRRKAMSAFDQALVATLGSGWISEVMLTDWRHEGHPRAFDPRIVDAFPIKDMPLILFGGLSTPQLIQRGLAHAQVAAVAVGNFLSYREHAVQSYKEALESTALRPASYQNTR